jgi:hypothetical protein
VDPIAVAEGRVESARWEALLPLGEEGSDEGEVGRRRGALLSGEDVLGLHTDGLEG